MREELERIREWADAKIQGGSEPPWAWYQYMKLIETIDAILAGAATTVTLADSQQAGEQEETHLQLVDGTYPQDSVPRRPVGLPILLPM
jgi:hypothetical protein